MRPVPPSLSRVSARSPSGNPASGLAFRSASRRFLATAAGKPISGELGKRILGGALALGLLSAAPAAAQLDEPDPSCFEPVKPACAEVTVGAEDDGWAMRCREELQTFLDQVQEYRRCVTGRIDRLQEGTESELQRLNCMLNEEAEGCE